MTIQRRIEIFSANCPACQDVIDRVNGIACPSCQVEVLDMQKADVASRAMSFGIRAVPAVVIDGKLLGCCASPGPSVDALRKAGVGQSDQ